MIYRGAQILYKPTKNEPILVSFLRDITFFYKASVKNIDHYKFFSETT